MALNERIDASLGLLANVPTAVLDRLFNRLNIGNPTDTIELTIMYRYSSLQTKELIEKLGGEFEDLGFNFAIVNIPVENILLLATNENIQYIELPKALYESDLASNAANCVPRVVDIYGLTGKGVLIGFIDSGIDYLHPAFLDSEGNTRIEYIYDIETKKVYDKSQINQAIKSNNPYSIVNIVDQTGHGTHVVGDACAGGNIPNQYKGVAPEASIAMVKGGRGKWILSSEILRGIKFLIDKSKELNIPLIINISLSTNNGAHNGSSLLEQYIRTVANLERVTIVIAAGNEGDSNHHTSGSLNMLSEKSFNVAVDENSLVINFYKSILPDVQINIIGPTGEESKVIELKEGYYEGNIGRDRYDIYVSGPKPFELESEVQVIISPITQKYIVSGVWKVRIIPLNIFKGFFDMWLPISETLNTDTKFLDPIENNTLGIPATVDNIISVGSYNPITKRISSFSGIGVTNKPNIVAPGEDIWGPSPNGGYDRKSGTSMAAPQVAGICALLTEWGIIQKNDLYLFGQRLKFYLIRGAERVRNDISYPNPKWGYGTVCAFNSIKILEETINSILSTRNRQLNNSEPDLDTLVKNIFGESITSSMNLNEEVGLYIPISSRDEVSKINSSVEGANAVALADSYALVMIPLKNLTKISNYIDGTIANINNPTIFTLTNLSPIDAAGVPIFANNPYLSLDGSGVLVGIIDTGIDYLNKEFMKEDDTTRIVKLWDQTLVGDQEVLGVREGKEFSEGQINEAIKLSMNNGDSYSVVDSKDEVGHGTMMAGLISGRGQNPDLRGVAPNSNLVVVKLKRANSLILQFAGVDNLTENTYDSVQVVLAIRYCLYVSILLKKPMVIYLPIGSNYGGHDGTGDVESMLETSARRLGVVNVVGTGNQGDTQTHIEGKIDKGTKMGGIDIKVGKNQNNLNFNIYCKKPNRVSIGIVSPSGETLQKVSNALKAIYDYKFLYEGTKVNIIYLLPDLASGDEVITIKFRGLKEGIWRIVLYGDYIVDGSYNSWLPQRELLDPDTRFINPIFDKTLTTPSTSRGAIAASYYDQDLNTTVAKSGRGYTRDNRIKPDIAAGGINALVTVPGGGTMTTSGSSIASSVLAGCCALLLQWGIVNKNDTELNLTKMISYIISGARMRPGDVYPNREWGYGLLDIKNVFERLRKSKNENLEYCKFEDIVNNTQNEKREFYSGKLFCRYPEY